MSEKLTKALEFTNYRTTLNAQHNALKAKTQSLLSYSVNGGTFSIDRTLMSFCRMLIDSGKKSAVLLDIYDNPIKVELNEFYGEIYSRYFEVMNEYYAGYEKLKRSRKTHAVLDLDEEGNEQ